jgi:hypothetical protein
MEQRDSEDCENHANHEWDSGCSEESVVAAAAAMVNHCWRAMLPRLTVRVAGGVAAGAPSVGAEGL